MKPLKKKLLENIHEKDVSELVEDHMEDISFDEEKKVATLSIDKRYAINILQTHGHIEPLMLGVKRVFGDSVGLIVQLANPHHSHEREMLIPFAIHYGYSQSERSGNTLQKT